MAQCLLHHGWLVLLKTGACCGLPIFFEVTTNWRAGCQKLACPVRREGRPESSSLPLSGRARQRADTPTPRSALVFCFVPSRSVFSCHMPSEHQPNRLIHEKSPYLLQHAHNPVDWYPWGPEAFQKEQ